MQQLLDAMAGPHGAATVITWVVAGIALAVAAAHALRPDPRRRGWSRVVAAAFPAAVAWTLLVGSVAPTLEGTALDVAMFLRMSGFWTVVALAPSAVGQVFDLDPPAWVVRTHVALGATFLVLLVTSDLVFTRTATFDPAVQFGPLAVVLLLPVGAVACWWLLTCLREARTRPAAAVFAVGAGVTTVALVAAGLVLDPGLADHLLVVGFLPVLAATQLVDLDRVRHRRQHRGRTLLPGHPL